MYFPGVLRLIIAHPRSTEIVEATLTSQRVKAKLDFHALEFVTKEFEQRWQDAREENFEDGHCTFGTVWKLFKPGDLVIRRDDLGNEWLLVLMSIQERRDVRQPPEPPWDYVDFKTWGLFLDDIDSELLRKTFTFRLQPFSERRKITSLPVYPLSQKGEEKEAFLKKIAARGRQWQALVKSAPSVGSTTRPNVPYSRAAHEKAKAYCNRTLISNCRFLLLECMLTSI